MRGDRHYDEEELADLLRLLPPAPEGWVAAARELPRTRRDIEQIVGRAEADADFRRALLADLEAALERAGWEPKPELIRDLRTRLIGKGGGDSDD
jgi:hypothetical protein